MHDELQEAADVQTVAAEEEAAVRQFIGETIVAAESAKQAALAIVTAKDATEAAQFAKDAAEAAKVAEVAAESAQLVKRTKETLENAKLARQANADAEFAKKTAADAKLAEEDKTILEATPVEAVLERRLGKLSLSEDCGGDQCKRDDCNCRVNTRGAAQGVVKTLNFS
uniref:uncharacterized protein LOC105349830 n=1 Tax=Fragaria vesca subsp. vesca TaxID=101020 RepID=UPI0005C7F037|nr:PREDICTED: uncharacterized protein LOC105349830 [Fragaria vesca subsp. vesca]